MSLPLPDPSSEPLPAAVVAAAADWLARRDRGLTPAEQDDYVQWLAADPRHARALAQQARALERMMQLYEWTPANAVEPNPDLFAPPRRLERVRHFSPFALGWRWGAGFGLAAALALAAVVWVGRSPLPAPAPLAAASPTTYLQVNERLALPDGSRIELNEGAQVVVLYSEHERRVRLAGGEAHFSVWKDATRPFVVEAGGVEVVAVGTAFNVRLGSAEIEVLVTEGRVRLRADGASPAAAVAPVAESADSGPAALLVSRGERAVVARGPANAAGGEGAPRISAVSSDEIAARLAWQAPRLRFHETRLADAVAEFNRLNRHQLELRDPGLGDLRIGGNFRPDNVEGFVRLLGLTFDLAAESPEPDRTVLFRAP